MNYKISGAPMPVVEIDMDRGESIYTQSGGMCWMTEGVDMQTNMKGGLLKGLGRLFTGESLFMVTYAAQQDGVSAAFAATMPGEIHKIDVCAEQGVTLSTYFQKKLGAGLFGGEGFLMQKLSGNGTAFLELGGSIVCRELAAGEKIIVDTSHVAYFESSCGFNVRTVKGVRNVLFGGEGLFLTELTGPGKVWLQTMTASNLAETIIPYIPKPSSN